MKEMAAFCFQEATLSAIIITFYMVLTDFVEQYIDQQSIPKWQKYMLTLAIMFVASFVSITFILFLFGYNCGTIAKKKICKFKDKK
jgi:ABC-type proline/glycine betaine transport system permease subunit